MRWLMLPVSAFAHAAAFAACLILPFAGNLEAPTPWPSASAPTFIAAAPAPPPAGPLVHRAASADRGKAPTSAPDHIEPEVPLPPAGIASDRIEPGADSAGAVPGGMPLDDFA